MPRLLLQTCVLACGLLSVMDIHSTLAMHPFHISIAEMEFNPQSKRLEVSLKLHANDIEQALAHQWKRDINIENDADADRLLSQYLSEHFYLTTKRLDDLTGPATEGPPADRVTRSKIHFVGKEFETTWLWLYFEISPPAAPPPQLSFVNSVLLNWTDGQINTARIRFGTKRTAVKTNVKQPAVRFDRDWLAPPKVPETPLSTPAH